ncbi:MAG: hypothetical protein MI864_08175 [Pseudomonadales bacterium]|nr:hypothetical protein [Pseudomonadales bacterium]
MTEKYSLYYCNYKIPVMAIRTENDQLFPKEDGITAADSYDTRLLQESKDYRKSKAK